MRQARCMPSVMGGCAILIGTPVLAEDAGSAVIRHLDCAVSAEMIAGASAPLADGVMPPAQASELADRHMRMALDLGVPLTDADDGAFPGMLRPRALGGSAEAGLGKYYADLYDVRDHQFERDHGAPDVTAQDMDARIDALRQWYRLRAAVMQTEYNAKECAELLAGSVE